MNEWVIIPAYNEASHIESIVRDTRAICKNVVVVSDGSKDRTAELADKSGAHVLNHLINLGKGAAVSTGITYAIEKGADTIVLMDADGQHEPTDIPRFLAALNGVDIVFGYRTFDRKTPLLFLIGNYGLSLITTLLFGLRIRDTQSGFRCFRASVYSQIKWNATDYAMESEMIAKAGRAGLRYTQISIRAIYKDQFKGTTVIDGLHIGLNLLAWRLRG